MNSRLACAFLLFFAIAHVAIGQNVLSKTYRVVESDLFEKREGLAILEVEWDAQPYYTLPSDQSLHSFKDYTLNASAPMLSAIWLCDESWMNPCEVNGTNGFGIAALSPTASPIQSFYSAIGTTFATQLERDNPFGWDLSADGFPTTTTRANRWAGVVKLWEEDTSTQIRKVCLPDHFLDTCQLITIAPQFIPNVDIVATGLCNATGTCYPTGFSLGTLTRKAPECSATALATAINGLYSYLDFDPYTVNNPIQLSLVALAIQARALDASFLGCIDLFASLIQVGTETASSNTTLCRRPLFLDNGDVNTAFLVDPCCNERAEFYDCCDKREVSYTRGNIAAIVTSEIDKCTDPAGALLTLLDIHNAITRADEICGTQQGFDDDAAWFILVWGPLQQCFTEVFNKDCTSDQDCPTGICTTGKCAAPIDNPSPYLSECLVSTLDPVTIRFWKHQWGLNVNSTMAQFIQAFQSHVFADTCVGPAAYDRPLNQTECEAKMNCNWNPAVLEQDCVTGSPNFCGFCATPKVCWSLTVDALCLIAGDEANCPGYWKADWRICVNGSASTREECSGYWFDGYYNTPEKCAEGACAGIGFNIPRDECSQSSYCSRTCPKCVSTVNSGACFTSLVEEGPCWNNGGVYYQSICMITNTNQTLCEANSGQWHTCGERNAQQCDNGVIATLLGCYFSTDAPCTTQQECESQGECNDGFLRSVSNPRAACVRPYVVRWDGTPVCEESEANGQQWYDVKFGCLNPFLSQGQCTANNYTWALRATNQLECEARKACAEPWRDTYSYKKQSDCLSCGGSWRSIFSWDSGKWLAGEVIDLSWKAKSYEQTNQWIPGIEFSERGFNRLLNVLLQPLGARIAYWAKAEGFCRLGLVTSLLQRVADDCGVAKRSISERAGDPAAIVGVFKAWSGIRQYFTAGFADIEVFENTIADYSDITLYATSASTLVSSAKRSIQQIGTTIDVEVKNNNNVAIGQVISDGFEAKFVPLNIGDYSLCVQRRADIKSNICYTVIDFMGPNMRPMDATITYSDDDTVCANFSNSGETYYAIVRAANWASYTTDPCSSTTTGSVSGGLTTTGAASGSATTGSSDSSSASTIAASLALLVALIALLL